MTTGSLTKMLTSAQVRAALGVSPNTLKSYIDAGDLPATRLPSGHYRFWPVDIELFLDLGRVKPEGAA